ncbi:MAG TPA: NADH-quinone oxidoreductase subunit K [Stenomitos sp.]
MNFLIPMIQSGLGLPHVLSVSAIVFSLGLFALLTQRHLVRLLMGLVLMLTASVINMAAFSAFLPGRDGHGTALLLMLALVVQLAVGAGLTITAYTRRRSVDVTSFDELGG